MTATSTLDQRYTCLDGQVYLSGLQALVRLPIDQQRRDRAAGLRTGTFISGYPGSPLGGYDLALRQARSMLDEHGVVHVPGGNEEAAATAISGTQMLDGYPHSRVDGVVAFWYGKGPGVDRSGDALKHGNFAGTSRHGAVVVLSGEDHEAKSSTMPFQDDYAFQSAAIPVVYPASTAEFLTLGLQAVAMSRYSGCWVAMKIVGALADGGTTMRVRPDLPEIVTPELLIDGRPFQKRTDFRFFPGLNIETERQLHYERHRAVVEYARANRLNVTERSAPGDRIGIVTAGKSFADLQQALRDMEITGADLERWGVRIMRVGLIYPLDGDAIRRFAHGVGELMVIEEKRGFLETQVKEALCGVAPPVRVLGKFDEAETPLFPIQGGMDGDAIARRLGPRLLALGAPHGGISRRLEQLTALATPALEVYPLRTPNYCSGCPHNVSTRLLEGEIAWGSPGCHSFASIIEQPERHIVSMTQLGGEGLPWIGLSHFTDKPHMVQNVGDGSLFHSSYLNIRFAVAAGVDMTFKILYNGSVANTGAQDPVGVRSVAELVRLLETEGVARIAVVTKDARPYDSGPLGTKTTVHGVAEQDEVLRELAAHKGVTVFIYDGVCANEKRRRQKRGKAAVDSTFVAINPEVCEGCGHCGALTNCMSLHKVETEFGEKTTVHTSSCNQDLSCLGGDCPSFVTVATAPGTGYRRPQLPAIDAADLREPVRPEAADPYRIYIVGVGGTGVITMNALLCQAALQDGLQARSYDQTGAAQKWGQVVSSLVVGRDDRALVSNGVPARAADVLLACDLLGAAASSHLSRCEPGRTAAVVNVGVLPTGEMVRRTDVSAPVERMLSTIERWTGGRPTVRVDARGIAETLFGDFMAANLVVLGAAYQDGLIPVSAAAIEAAIHLNNVAVSQNLQAFRAGRLWVQEPAAVERLLAHQLPSAAREPLDRLRGEARRRAEAAMARCANLDAEAQRLVRTRVAELIAYQNADLADAYVDFVLQVAERESRAAGRGEITRAVSRYYYKLLAYKDEYEVARLHVKTDLDAQLQGQFTAPRRVTYHLHPPLLRALGMRRKLRLGPWFKPALRGLASLRGLRGTPVDPFGYARVRREERALIVWYRDVVVRALERLDVSTYDRVLSLASLPDRIRGYEDIKLANAADARRHADVWLKELDAAPAAAGKLFRP